MTGRARVHFTQLEIARVLLMFMRTNRKCRSINGLAIRAGVSPETISRILDAKSDLRVSTLAFICDALGIKITQFYEQVESRPIKQAKSMFAS